MANEPKEKFNWEKAGIYIAVMSAFFSLIFVLIQIKDNMADIRERVAKLEVKVEKLEEKTK